MNNGKTGIRKKRVSLLEFLVILSSSLLTLFFIIILLPRPTYKNGFRNLSELKEYASTIDESIKMETGGFLYPTYDAYYQKTYAYTLGKNLREKFVWFFSSLGLVRKPIFSASFFKSLLKDVTIIRQKKGWTGNFVQKFEALSSSKTVVFGAVQGAFHGLVRDLEQLEKLGIIDENLKIRKFDYRIVFLGNVVNRSPYTLEIFSIVLRLMQVNPDNVIYLRSANELSDYWIKDTLKRELEYRVAHLSKQKIPLEKEVNTFFDTLPMNVYCTIPLALSDNLLPYVRFSSYKGDNTKPNELSLVSFLKKSNVEQIECFDIKDLASNPLPEANKAVGRDVQLKAVVKDILKREEYEEMDGLRLLSFSRDVATWTVLSTAAELYRKLFDFFYDAFVVIDSASKMDQWLITVYKRDVRDKDPVFKSRACYFFSGVDIKNS